jgi:hypothetical protein
MIEVVNDTNAVLPGAHVVVHWEPVDLWGVASNIGIPRDIVGKTDRDGRFSADLPEGFYDVFVAWGIMSPRSSKIRVERGKPARHRTVLVLDPVIFPFVAHPSSN